MFLVVEIDEKGRKLANVTHECLELAITACGLNFLANKVESVMQ